MLYRMAVEGCHCTRCSPLVMVFVYVLVEEETLVHNPMRLLERTQANL